MKGTILVHQAAITKYHRLEGSNNRKCFFHSSGGQKSEIKVSTGFVSSETSLFDLQMAISLHLQVMEKKEFFHSVLAEPKAKHQESQWKKTGYFIMNSVTQENGKLMLSSLNFLVQDSVWVFNGRGGTGMRKCLWGKIQLQDFGAWPFMVGLSTQDLPGQPTLCLSSSYILILGFLRGSVQIFIPGAAGALNSLPCPCSGFMPCHFDLPL